MAKKSREKIADFPIYWPIVAAIYSMARVGFTKILNPLLQSLSDKHAAFITIMPYI